jgi:hypothetical protein
MEVECGQFRYRVYRRYTSGKDLVPGTTVGVALAFDNDASRNGQFTFVTGDVELSQILPLYKREENGGGREWLTLYLVKRLLSLRVGEISSVKFHQK